jgi:hypothetical protein
MRHDFDELRHAFAAGGCSAAKISSSAAACWLQCAAAVLGLQLELMMQCRCTAVSAAVSLRTSCTLSRPRT